MTDDDKTLVKRLRWSASGKVNAEQARLERNAADRIEAQAAEIERLREALAAAPDLLEACEAFLIYDDAADYERSLHRNVQTLTRAAITKARGEASNIARAALAGKAEQ